MNFILFHIILESEITPLEENFGTLFIIMDAMENSSKVSLLEANTTKSTKREKSRRHRTQVVPSKVRISQVFYEDDFQESFCQVISATLTWKRYKRNKNNKSISTSDLSKVGATSRNFKRGFENGGAQVPQDFGGLVSTVAGCEGIKQPSGSGTPEMTRGATIEVFRKNDQ